MVQQDRKNRSKAVFADSNNAGAKTHSDAAGILAGAIAHHGFWGATTWGDDFLATRRALDMGRQRISEARGGHERSDARTSAGKGSAACAVSSATRDIRPGSVPEPKPNRSILSRPSPGKHLKELAT